LAHRYYPLEREEALAKGYTWQDIEYAVNIPAGLEQIQGADLPKTIAEV
jgi:hypothetical protein